MILQDSFNESYYLHMIIIDPILIVAFTFFFLVTFRKFLSNKSKIALNFSLSNLFLSIALIFVFIGTQDALQEGEMTDLNRMGIFLMGIFIILSSMFLYLFRAEISNISKKKRNFIVGLGIAFILFMLLPQNGWLDSSEGFKLKYISFLMMAVYMYIVYIGLLEFFKLARKVDSLKKEFFAIGLGALLMLGYITINTIRVFEDAWLLQIIGIVLILLSMCSIFFGYIRPALINSNKGEESREEINKAQTKNAVLN